MLKGFIDDSGNDGRSAFLVLAGYLLPYERWVPFTQDWQAALDARPAIRYFHMVEAEHGDGEFLGIEEPFRKMKLNDLVTLIEKHQLAGLVSYIRLTDWENTVEPFARQGFKNPYYPLFTDITHRIVEENLAQRTECSVAFVFDDKSDVKHQAVEMHERVRKMWEAVPEVHRLLGATPEFQDDKKVLPLQAADILVWHWRRRLDFPSEKRDIWQRLDNTVNFEQHLDAEYLSNLLRNDLHF